MKGGLINIKDERRQEQRRLDSNHNKEHHLSGDGCFGAQIRYAWIKESSQFTKQNYQAAFNYSISQEKDLY